MQFDWDEKKRLAKKAERRIDFADAGRFFRSFVYEYPSPRDGEDRMVAVGMLDGQYISYVYVDRDGTRRIVTSRRAWPKEIRAYERAKHHAG
ncbi:MAG: BrnT family toxin [Alphaproteobacteria bacterium]|nr:BrnT family toxin [Alphaproteobacteria bacterium]